MNGERIFMWYSRSYVQLKRLTGPGWGGDVSSLEYLKRSVPQFLVRYVRDNYVPDAVMIYGAYVDNAAIPAHGEAPAIEAWNKEFEFPKLIVATDADYFNYVEKHFADRLPVYRGDCGAYWEDGVGSTMHATISEPPDAADSAGGGNGRGAGHDLRAAQPLSGGGFPRRVEAT